MATDTRELSHAEKLEWRLRALHRYADRLVRESEAHYQAWIAAGRPGTTAPAAPEPEGDPSRLGWWRDHDHYDRDGYCDNPGRGY